MHLFKRLKLCYIEAAAIAIAACALLFPTMQLFKHTGDNFFTIRLNGVEVGNLSSTENLDALLIKARLQAVKEIGSDELVFMDAELQTEGSEKFWAVVDDEEDVVERMVDVMKRSTRETLHRSYTVKVNETAVNLGSYNEVHELLEQALAPYDTRNQYHVALELDNDREINVLEAVITLREEALAEEEEFHTSAGITADLERMFAAVEPEVEKDFEDYAEGLTDIDYAEKIEVVEAYLLEEELNTVEEAVNLVTKEQETQIIYKVVSGDTLSQISLTNNIPMDKLIAINDALEDENTMIRIDQELVLTVPEPELSIMWKEEQVYIEDYEAEVQYIPNDNWYTTQRVTLQEPSAGRRKVAAVISYKNGQEIGREILKEEIYAEAVPKIVERGTKIPPTYIKPISGGRLSSGFGARSAPTKGASTYHKGVDWATPIGTSVVASNAGTVVHAGWASGYGYAVYINHSDGRQTRYGHLSKVLVKVGQTVSQGERIALSGNTGRSTGPHLHFEIRINGSAVNPLKHLN
ncbi:MAG: M23 family metallopeptidase [Lachnospiraceae bacterium]|nr:M23 family metallopeptidase [Lachnospiraceae bacterium]